MVIKRKYTKNFSEASVNQPAYTLYNQNGEEVGTTNTLPEGVIAGQTVFRNDSGELTAVPETNISLNEDTGKITVKAPELALKNESFKTSLSDTLKKLTSTYKTNPDYKFSIINEEGATEEKSIQDIINDLNAPSINEDGSYNQDSLQYMATAALGIEKIKAAHKKNVDLDDNDVMRISTVAIGPDVKDDTLQLISNLPEAAWLRNISSYDKETGFAKYGDIMENAYNKEKVSSEDMIKLWAALENYFAKGDYSDKEEYIRNVATARFLDATQPNMAWIRDVTENVNGFLNSIGGYATELGTGINVARELLVDFFGFEGDMKAREEYYNVYGSDSSELYIRRGGNQFATDMPLEKVDAKIGRIRFDENGVPSYIEEKIEGSYANPKTDAETMRAIFKENQAVILKDIEYLHESQAGWDAVGYALTNLATLISAGNLLSDVFTVGAGIVASKATANTVKVATTMADTVSALYASGSALSYGTTAAEVAQIVSGLKTIYDIAAATGKSATFLNFIGQAVASAKTTEFIIGVVGESIAEAIVGDNNRFIEVLNNKEIDAGTKDYLISTYVGNALGWGVGLGVGKFLMKTGETTRGRAISANLSRRIFKVQNAVGDAFDRTLLTIRRVKGDDLAEKIKTLYEEGGRYAKKQANALAASAKLREMRQKIADLDAIKISGKSTDEINEALENIESKILELKNAEVALTSMQRQGVDIVQGWLKDEGKGLKAVTENFYTKAGKVAEMEKNAGDLFKPTRGVVSDMTSGKPLKLFSQTTTNYIKASEKIDFINAYIKKYEHAERVSRDILDKIKKYREELPELREMVRLFNQNAPSGLKLAANNFIDADRKWWAKYEDLRARLGLTDADELNWFRRSNLWGTNGELYARTTRKADLSEYVVKHRDGTSNVRTFDNYEQYMAGATGDFADPMGEMQIALYDAGNKQAYRSFAKSYNKLTGTAMVKVSGEETALYQKMKKGLRSNYFDSSETLLKGFAEDVQSKSIVENVIKNLQTKNTQYKDIAKTKGAMKTAVKNMQQKLTEVTSANANKYIIRLGTEDTTALWDDFYDVPLRELLEDGGDAVPLQAKRFIYGQARELGVDVSEISDYPFNFGKVDELEESFREYISYNIPDNYLLEDDFWRSPTLRGATPDASFHTYGFGKSGKDVAKTYGVPERYDFSDKRIIDARNESGLAIISDIMNHSGDKSLMKFADELEDIPIGEDRVITKISAFKNKDDELYKKIFTELKKYDIDGFATNASGFDEAFIATDAIKAPESAMVRSKLLKTYDNVNKVLAGTADTPDMVFEQQVKRIIMSHNDDILNDTRVQKALTEKERFSYLTKNEMFYRGKAEELEFLEKQYGITKEELSVAGGTTVRSYMEHMTEEGTPQRNTIDELCKFYGLEGDENAIEYFALSAYMDNRGKYKAKLRKQIRELIDKEHDDLLGKDAKKITNIITNGIDSSIENEFDDAYLVVKELNPNAVRETDEKVMKEVDRIAKEIEGAEANRYAGEKNIIAMRNMQGKVEYYQTDPLLARLVNFQYLPEKMNGFTQAIYNTNYLWAKLFRLGTTAINLKSMISQSFRDPINMFIGGGAYRTTQRCMDDIVDVAGDDIVAWIKTYEPEVLGRLQKEASETGESLQKLAVEREFDIGRGLSPTTTETWMYRSLNTAKRARLNGVLDVYDDTLGDKTVRAIDKVGETLGKPNEWRETTLRNLSYQNGFAVAIKRGYSVDQARTFATFVMNEATTNFTRMTNHLVSLKDTVPYFGSAVNGAKSFYKLLSMDPVGVTGRLIGGLIIPTIALVTYSLMDEKNREIYKNIPEYQKEDALVFVVDGQILSIPIPQEMGSFMAPFRQMVEGMYGASTNTFAELAWHDILGFSPVDLTGFANLDFAKLETSSPGFLNRIGDGIARMWSQLAPPVLKSGLEIVTGVDPYTGKTIDKSYPDYDEDGNPIVKDYQSGELAKLLNKMFRSWGLTSSAPVVQNILSNIVGQGSVDILDFLVSLGTQVPDGGWAFSATETQLAMGEAYNPFYVVNERLISPITMDTYNEAQSAWKTEVTKLYTMKDEILNSKEWEEYIKARKSTSDPEKLKNINASGKNIVRPYYEAIKTAVNNLQANYGEEFTAAKYATVLSLMTMDKQTLDLSSYGDYLDREAYKTARSQAIQTMIDMGFPSSSSTDILGKFVTNKDGDIFVRTYSPLAILQLDDTSGASVYSQSSRQHYAVIKGLVSDAGLFDERSKYQKLIKASNANKDYTQSANLAKEYNEKVIKAVGEYIRQYTPESVLRGDTLDFLKEYVIVPSDFQVNKYGKHVTALGNGAYLSDAFKEPYLKYIFNYGENKL